MKTKPDFYVVAVEAYPVEDPKKHFTLGSFFFPFDDYQYVYRAAVKCNKMEEANRVFEMLEKFIFECFGIEVTVKCKVKGINYVDETNLVDSTKLCVFADRA